ncbi:MAG: hypothetical protein COY81_00500 [Candidatus Pacebacteria bacterium CG_4_10_14_0_8_um_filter_43_12]|nr:MAG: hypothetical protein COY81_00500 [Candidatus Pacebacteria bacterium CG_4_10_14_0_8_um_filter_43_12]
MVQLYFVLASITGLILLIIPLVSLFELGLGKLIGVRPYPEFTAPYPPTYTDSQKLADIEQLTESQTQALARWETEYQAWQDTQSKYNQAEQTFRREIAQSLAMLLVGIPVFWIHAPKIFKKENPD